MPQFPGADRERLWRAWGGCIDADGATRSGHPLERCPRDQGRQLGVVFQADAQGADHIDRGKKADLDEIKVNLHGASGSIEVHTSRDPIDPWKLDVRTMGIGPLAYQERVRRTLVAFVDPDQRIVLPKASRSAGW